MEEKTAHKIFLFFLFTTIIAISVFNFGSVLFRKPIQTIEEVEQDNITQQIEFWEDLVRSHPTYRDGYKMLSRLYEESGQVLAAQDSKNRAQSIDPNN